MRSKQLPIVRILLSRWQGVVGPRRNSSCPRQCCWTEWIGSADPQALHSSGQVPQEWEECRYQFSVATPARNARHGALPKIFERVELHKIDAELGCVMFQEADPRAATRRGRSSTTGSNRRRLRVSLQHGGTSSGPRRSRMCVWQERPSTHERAS